LLLSSVCVRPLFSVFLLKDINDPNVAALAQKLDETRLELSESRSRVEELEEALGRKETELKDHIIRIHLLENEQREQQEKAERPESEQSNRFADNADFEQVFSNTSFC